MRSRTSVGGARREKVTAMACISHGAATFAANAIELVAGVLGVPLETDANVGARAEVVAVRATGPPGKRGCLGPDRSGFSTFNANSTRGVGPIPMMRGGTCGAGLPSHRTSASHGDASPAIAARARRAWTK